jgi:hypothetical protein
MRLDEYHESQNEDAYSLRRVGNRLGKEQSGTPYQHQPARAMFTSCRSKQLIFQDVR